MRVDPSLKRFAGPVFVTGGSGFIGSHVVRELIAMGREVRCLVLPEDQAPALRDLDVTRVNGSLLDQHVLDDAVDGCELVIHLAALFSLWLKDASQIHRVNVEGTRRVMRAARKNAVKRVVYTSSIAAVGHVPGQGLSDESTAFNDWHIKDDYVVSKYVSELEALRPENLEAMDVIAVNPTFPFGPWDIGPTPTGRLILTILRGQFPFIVPGGCNAVDVRDVATAHLLAADLGDSGERYILGGHNITYRQLLERVMALDGTSGRGIPVPAEVMHQAGRLGSAYAALTGRPPLLTYASSQYTTGRYLWASHAKAARVLGYTPRSLDDALRGSIAWFKGPDSPHPLRTRTRFQRH